MPPETPPSIPDDGYLIRRHHLPHWQQGGSVYFITFRSTRGPLPTKALKVVQETILEGDGGFYRLSLGVIMPDHVHLILRPTMNAEGRWYDLAAIMQRIKGRSARRVNLALGTSGAVWQKESFDRIIRDEQEYLEKLTYICNNPLKAGLVRLAEAYPYFIRPANI